MRKIIYYNHFDETTFIQRLSIIQKLDDNTTTIIDDSVVLPSEYSASQQIKIDYCNKILEKNKNDCLSTEEIAYMLDPGNIIKYSEFADKNNDIGTMQALAGFKVEKTIKYTNE